MIPIARPQMGNEEKDLVWSALESGQLAQGGRVREFEERFAAFVGVRHAVATSSGTTALHLALLALGMEPGDEVIVPSFSFTATASAVVHAGGRPVFADVEAEYFTLDPARVDQLVTPRTRAIMPVSLYGQPADLAAIMEIGERRGIPVLEDACQAHGASLHGRSSGAWGVGAFSFYPTKNMTTGEGGIITTDDGPVAERARLLREHGMRVRYQPEILGYNFRMTDVHASIGLAQLAKLPAANERRQAIAARYDAALSDVVRTPRVRDGATHVYHQYTMRVPERDRFAEILSERGVGSNVYYPVPIHRQEPFVEFAAGADLPVTETLTAEILSIPVYPTLTDAEVDTIVEAVTYAADRLGSPAATG